MNNIQLPIDPIQILLAALLQAASMLWALLTALPWWALLLLGLLLVFRLLRPELGVSPAKNTHPKRLRRRRW
ncbi:MAG: hypothetical protein AAGI37_16235 [Planctomycetota bacterium]